MTTTTLLVKVHTMSNNVTSQLKHTVSEGHTIPNNITSQLKHTVSEVHTMSNNITSQSKHTVSEGSHHVKPMTFLEQGGGLPRWAGCPNLLTII